nr:protein MOTHER of FT and TFL1-like [Ipomoea batatas]
MANANPRSVDPLVVGKVIGDVLDMFVPVVEFTVDYGSKKIANGVEITPSSAAQKPSIMVDPDAPSPSEPTFREWLHWIVKDIPEGSEASKGREVVEYIGPSPPTGIHRYVLALFRQREAMQVPQKPPEGRGNFRTRQFAADNGLGLPVAALYFNSQKQSATNKKR